MEVYGGSAIQQYFNQLINMRLLRQVVVSDRQGNIILDCFGGDCLLKNEDVAISSSASSTNANDLLTGSNVVRSGAYCFQNMEQLRLGVPEYIALQYHDNVVLQSLDECCILTLIGSRSQGHFVGGLLVLLPQIRRTEAYIELLEKLRECFQ